MKKLIGFLLLFLAAFSLQVFAKDPPVAPPPPLNPPGPFVKLGRGLTNIITAPGELYMQPVIFHKRYDPFTSFFGGLFKGITFMLLRQLSGIYEVATFPIPLPQHYQPLWDEDVIPLTVPAAFKKEFGER